VVNSLLRRRIAPPLLPGSIEILGDHLDLHTLHTNFLVSPSYIRLRQVLTKVLRGYPDAAAAVAHELHALEHEAAEEVRAQPKMVEFIEASPC
jgi:hypothetical protein